MLPDPRPRRPRFDHSNTMSDLPVIIFGSFTYEETVQIRNQYTRRENVNKVKNNHESSSSIKIAGLRFGSLDFAPVDIEGGLWPAASNDKGAAASCTRKGVCENGKRKCAHEPQSHPRANGWISSSSLEITKLNVDLGSVHISDNTSGSTSEIAASPRVNDADDKESLDGAITSFDYSTRTAYEEEVDELKYMPPVSGKSLLPRGLINPGNLCFLNATLQALLCCSPFVWLLQDLKNRKIPKTGYTMLQAFIEFISEFDMTKESNMINIGKPVLETGSPFTPAMFEPVLKYFTPDIHEGLSGRPRQEDAQEFLSFVMDQMHNELLKLEGQSSSNGGIRSFSTPAEDDGWETVGPKNKSAVTRTQSFIPSALSAIFGGQLRSVVKARGNKASATVQPYLLLHLDILPEDVHTIEDALHLFSIPEALEGYKASSGKAGLVSASKSVKIQTLSKILILHLMRFSYGCKGTAKLHKPVHFPLELIIGRDLLASPNSEGWTYELVSTITHHGRDPSKGHYTADARYSDGRWLRFDDSSVTILGTNQVLHDQAYVLFYRQV